MSRDEARPEAGTTWGLRESVAGLVVGTFASVLVGAAVLAFDDFDVDAPTGTGAYVGRVAAQTALGEDPSAPGPPLSVLALLQVPLWIGLLGAPLWAVWSRGGDLAGDLGARMRARDVPVGLAVGLVAQLVLVPVIYLPLSPFIDNDEVADAARELTVKATDPLGVVLLSLVVVVGAPVVEELFFRGLLMGALTRRWGATVGIVGSSLVFGIVHLQPLQFPALVAFGLVAALLVVRTGRLGPALWAHVAFNATTVVVLLS